MLAALAFMIASTISFSLMHVCVRELTAVQELHPFVVAFFRCGLGAMFLFAWLIPRRVPVPRGKGLKLIGVRAFMNTAAMLSFFAALSMTPLTTVTSLMFTAPLFAAAGAWLFLGEKWRSRRIVALVLGFAGVLVVLRPGFGPMELGPYLTLTSALIWAVSMLVIKRLTQYADSATITAYSSAMMTVLILVPALVYWDWPTWPQMGWLVVIAILGNCAQFTLAEALRRADATAVMPFDFLKIVWASVLGYLVLNEVPSPYAWIGGAVIFASSIYIAYRESRIKQTTTVAPPPAG